MLGRARGRGLVECGRERDGSAVSGRVGHLVRRERLLLGVGRALRGVAGRGSPLAGRRHALVVLRLAVHSLGVLWEGKECNFASVGKIVERRKGGQGQDAHIPGGSKACQAGQGTIPAAVPAERSSASAAASGCGNPEDRR